MEVDLFEHDVLLRRLGVGWGEGRRRRETVWLGVVFSWFGMNVDWDDWMWLSGTVVILAVFVVASVGVEEDAISWGQLLAFVRFVDWTRFALDRIWNLSRYIESQIESELKVCSETARKLLGNYSESALELLWSYHFWRLFWNWFEVALRLIWSCSETALKLLF